MSDFSDTNLADPKAIVLRFNECINNRDIKGLSNLMTDDHTFIDSENRTDTGKSACIEAWTGFFKMFPDYKNIFTQIETKGNLVTITGYSTCSDKRLEGLAIWTAKIKDGRVSEWRVYTDTQENRDQLLM